jgi:hypothetical protein
MQHPLVMGLTALLVALTIDGAFQMFAYLFMRRWQ